MDRETKRDYSRAWKRRWIKLPGNREKVRQLHRKWRRANPDKVRLHYRRWYRKPGNREKVRLNANRFYHQLRQETLRHYGKGRLACRKCGYSRDVRALALDHIKGGGRVDYVRRGCKGGTHFYSQLKKEGWPPGYQT